MDYTDLATFKEALGSEKDTHDDELGRIITVASRSLDRRCAGGTFGSDNYFLSEDVVDEQISGQINNYGRVICYPHKPIIDEVSAFAYRHSPLESWKDQDQDYLTVWRNQVTAWTSDPNRERVFVKISYTGGLALELADLPADLIEATTLLAVRYYKEIRSGLGDSIGVAELGTLIYTKAWPTRVLEMIQPYVRVIPWM